MCGINAGFIDAELCMITCFVHCYYIALFGRGGDRLGRKIIIGNRKLFRFRRMLGAGHFECRKDILLISVEVRCCYSTFQL